MPTYAPVHAARMYKAPAKYDRYPRMLGGGLQSLQIWYIAIAQV